MYLYERRRGFMVLYHICQEEVACVSARALCDVKTKIQRESHLASCIPFYLRSGDRQTKSNIVNRPEMMVVHRFNY